MILKPKNFLLLFLIFAIKREGNCEDNNGLIIVESPDGNDESNFNKVENIYVSNEVFIPTSEWQTIKKDQGIPRGLHIRLNVQTGLKEAKLLEEKNHAGQMKSKESLERINDNPIPSDEHIRKAFRNYEQLKQDMKQLDLNLQTDSEIIKQLIGNLQTSRDDQDKIKILTDMEYYVHKFDNGLLLCDLGGFSLIMNELNSSSKINLKMQAALVLGSSLQSNPKVQLYALNSNLLQLLLSELTVQEESPNQTFISRLVFTLSGLLRNMPIAQTKFIQLGGLEVFNRLLKDSAYAPKLKAKLLTLVNDLIIEKANAAEDASSSPNATLKYQQYLKYDLIRKIGDTDWCVQFEPILKNAYDNDTYEKVLNALQGLLPYCKPKLSPSILNTLRKIKERFIELSKEGSSEDDYEADNYFIMLTKQIEMIMTKIGKSS